MTSVRRENAKNVINRWNSVFQALAAEPRRQIIVSLLDAPAGNGIPLPESAMNPEVPVEFDELTAKLYHRHLPLLADEKLITWSEEPMMAYRGPCFDEAAVVMDAIQSSAQEAPDSLVIGCRRLETERQRQQDGL